MRGDDGADVDFGRLRQDVAGCEEFDEVLHGAGGMWASFAAGDAYLFRVSWPMIRQQWSARALFDHVQNRAGGVFYGQSDHVAKNFRLMWLRELDDLVEGFSDLGCGASVLGWEKREKAQTVTLASLLLQTIRAVVIMGAILSISSSISGQ